jgi:oligopeptide/dipeptide ABC transporter ATP-binding protein
LWTAPAHPYTRALVAAQPRAIAKAADERVRDARGVDVGMSVAAAASGVPDASASWAGRCAYANRCPETIAACSGAAPDLITIGDHRSVRCHARAGQPRDDGGR